MIGCAVKFKTQTRTTGAAQRELVIKQSSHYHTNESWATIRLEILAPQSLVQGQDFWKEKKNVKSLFSFIWKLEATHTPTGTYTHLHHHKLKCEQKWRRPQRQRSSVPSPFFCFSVMVQLNPHKVSVALLTVKPELEPACAWFDSRITGPRSSDPISAGLTCTGQPLRAPPSLPHCFHWMVGRSRVATPQSPLTHLWKGAIKLSCFVFFNSYY